MDSRGASLTPCLLLIVVAATFVASTSVAQANSGDPQHATESQQTLSSSAQAWDLLRSGLRDDGKDKRSAAVRALGLLKGDKRAISEAVKALKDDKAEVRASAAAALGELGSPSTIGPLRKALSDDEVVVSLSAAHALMLLKDKAAYEVYYSLLMGDRKAGKGLIEGQLDTLKNPKKAARMGFEEGIGFVPFGSVGYTALKTILKDETAQVRAAAASALATDPDPMSADALIQVAATDKNELVRVAAVEAISRRGDPALRDRIAVAMDDSKDVVKYTAAAAVLHLTGVAAKGKKRKGLQ